ncbi:nucleotidyltransferase domain-containing protein [bacterium]|nr:nucleotidyltransferase domain-containing protein [bacterium]
MTKIKNLSSNELKAVKEFKRELLKNFQVIDFRLFGSKARGDFNKKSDIDLLVVLKNVSKKNKDKIYDLANDILFKYGIDLSVKIFAQKEYNYLNNIPSVFMQLVKREGISL